jgi:hypothetical protein
MSESDQKRIIAALLKRHGRTFADELGIKLQSDTPSALFGWLCAALLFSAPIGNEIATAAARALSNQGWTTPEEDGGGDLGGTDARAELCWLPTSRMLAGTSELVLERYSGDLRKLREAAGRNPKREKELLMECKGIGEVGADIFLREVQVAWTELQPFADVTALKSASKVGLPKKAEELAKMVTKKDFPRLLAALVRYHLAKDHKEMLAAAKER